MQMHAGDPQGFRRRQVAVVGDMQLVRGVDDESIAHQRIQKPERIARFLCRNAETDRHRRQRSESHS